MPWYLAVALAVFALTPWLLASLRSTSARQRQTCRTRIERLARRVRREHADWYR